MQEVDALVSLFGLEPGERVLDVGCGPGRHALELASRGFDVVGVDISAHVRRSRQRDRRSDRPGRLRPVRGGGCTNAGRDGWARARLAGVRADGVRRRVRCRDLALSGGVRAGRWPRRTRRPAGPRTRRTDPGRDRRSAPTARASRRVGVLGLLPGSLPRGSRHLRRRAGVSTTRPPRFVIRRAGFVRPISGRAASPRESSG